MGRVIGLDQGCDATGSSRHLTKLGRPAKPCLIAANAAPAGTGSGFGRTGCGCDDVAIRILRSPAAFFDDSTFSPPLKPRILTKRPVLLPARSTHNLGHSRALLRPSSSRSPPFSCCARFGYAFLRPVARGPPSWDSRFSFGRNLLLAGTLLRGGLFRRDVRALIRDRGGFTVGF
jgi:hypothetical protein